MTKAEALARLRARASDLRPATGECLSLSGSAARGGAVAFDETAARGVSGFAAGWNMAAGDRSPLRDARLTMSGGVRHA